MLATTSADSKLVDANKLVETGNVEVDTVGNAHNNGKSDINGHLTSETIFCVRGRFVVCVGVVVCVEVCVV